MLRRIITSYSPLFSLQSVLRLGLLVAVGTILSLVRSFFFLHTPVATTKYTPDPFYSPSRMAEFTAGRLSSWGLNVVVWSAVVSPPDASAPLQGVYEAWRAAAEKELAGTGAVIYPWTALHITGMTPSPYSAESARAAAGWTVADRAAMRAAWAATLQRAQAGGGGKSKSKSKTGGTWPREPFPLIFSAPRFSNGVGIMDIVDPTGAVTALRAAVAGAAAEGSALHALPRSLLASAGTKAPNIIHSTMIRLANTREATLSDAQLEERFTRASQLWPGPITIMAHAAHLIEGNEFFVLAGGRPQDSIVLSLNYE